MAESSKIKLYCAYYAQDDPTKNTAIKLAKFNLVTMRKNISQCPRNAIILDPFSPYQLNSEDEAQITQYGLVVIDCSWNQIDQVFKKPFENGRHLPPLLASNSINYGKWNKLSSVEALAASLKIIGKKEQAEFLLSKFRWGEQFWKLNTFS